MFETYLEDAFHFLSIGLSHETSKEQERYLRVAVFAAASALESFLNYLADGFETNQALQPYELALLLDRKFALENGKFEISKQTEFRRLEDKLRFLLARYCPKFSLAATPAWSAFDAFKRLRDDITHPREEKDIGLERMKKELPKGMNAVIDIIEVLLQGIYGHPLRPKISDLRVPIVY